MKQATGEYEGVKPITYDETIAMIPRVFGKKRGQLETERKRLGAEQNGGRSCGPRMGNNPID